MIALARLLERRAVAWTVMLASLAIAGVGALFATQVEHDDDLLAFLPESDPDVAVFREIASRFGGLDVALVGIEADPFDPAVFARLRAVTKALDDAPEVELALSLANVDDFTPQEGGGIRTDYLVREVPAAPAARAALRDKVMSRDLVVGQLVSPEGDAVALYCFASHGQDPRAFAATVRTAVEAAFPDTPLYWGGAPFVSSYIFTMTQEDLRKLTPWAVFAVIVLVFLAFRDVIGAALALVSTGMGIAVSMGLMGLLGVRYNIVLSSMPVILFSVGSAYGIHVLARIQAAQRAGGTRAEALAAVAPTVIVAGLTTVGGLLSFLTMDIEPMRTFGLFTAIGIFSTLVFSLTFVPAVVRVFGLKARGGATGRLSDALVPMVTFAQRRRFVVGGALLAVAGAGAGFAAQVDTRMDQTAFFAPDSEPARADRFFLTHFGGSQFIQVHLRGDFEDPHVLRALERFADEVRAHETVSGVQHVAQVIALTNAAMEGARRIPDDAAKVRFLYTFLAGRPAVDQLLTRTHDEAVLHVKIGTTDISDVEALLADVETMVERRLPAALTVVPGDTEAGRASLVASVTARLRYLLEAAGHRVDGAARERLQAALQGPAPSVPARAIAADAARYLLSEEALVDLSAERPLAEAVAARVAALGPRPAEAAREVAIRAAVGDRAEVAGDPVDLVVQDLVDGLGAPLDEVWRRHRAAARAEAAFAAVGVDAPDAALVTRARDAASTLDAPTAAIAAPDGPLTLEARVSGLPVLHRGLSRSATRNQLYSLALALGLVVVILSVTFRSLRLGLIAASPTALTLLVVYGGMGWLGVHLDIGTAMLASIIIGAGVDYAVHFVAAWRAEAGPDAGERAVRETGPAIWTNALMVAAGFFLLTLGEARTLQNVGGLTAAAMLTAAIATFCAIPVLMARAPRAAEEPLAPISNDALEG